MICNQSFSGSNNVTHESSAHARLLQAFSANSPLGFIVAPLFFFLIPLKVSLSIVIGCVVMSVVAQAVFNHCSPALQELFSKYFTLHKHRVDTRVVEFIETHAAVHLVGNVFIRTICSGSYGCWVVTTLYQKGYREANNGDSSR